MDENVVVRKYFSRALQFPVTNVIRCHCISDKKEEKWKIQLKPRNPFQYLINFFLCIKCLVFLLLCVKPASCQIWDGVVVTEANYQALQAFKQELNDPIGFLRSWNNSGYGACSGGWTGIKCAQGQVIVIQLPWKHLGGRISQRIGELQGLRKLSLHDNLIGGAIPSSLGFLPNLRGLQLFNNKLTGSIPPSLGACLLLQTLDLSNNSLTSSIPTSLVNSTKLYRINLRYNSLSGPIPFSLTHSTTLVFLSLQHNNLSGSIPNTWGGTQKNNVFKLRSLTLDHNFFTGSFPSSLGSLREIQEVSISNNQLSGPLPKEIGSLSRLKTLDLSNNAMNGSLPGTLSNLTSLSVVNLRRNQIRGQIPATIGNIFSLTQLDLSQNNLSGEIPASLGSLRSLMLFNVSYNNLSGSVPASLSQKFNASSFIGNIQLCGYSSSTRCPSQPGVPSPSPQFPQPQHRKLSTKDIILIVTGVLLVTLLVLCCILLFCLIRKRAANGRARGRGTPTRTEKGVSPAGDVEGGEAGGKLVHFDGPIAFTADDLLCATAEIMGKSTYGTVYKATLEDGNHVVVKRLREKITKSQREFETEVNVLGKIRHPYLLALRAYYLGPKGEKLLVFDYMPKGSLAAFLHDPVSRQVSSTFCCCCNSLCFIAAARGPETQIDWPTRMRIAQGMTRGLHYLHNNENIIHGNLTSSNVLLDESTNVKISDYGLAHLVTAAASSNLITTAGALGYRAPELSKLKKANAKTDVYSLGVILLELLTGKSPGEAMNGVALPQWVASVVKEEWTNEVFDVELMRDPLTIGDELLNTLKLALHCVDPSPPARPEVQHVLQQLEDIIPERPTSSAGDDDVPGAPSTSE